MIAKYTQALIDDLIRDGKASVRFGGGMSLTPVKARSRLNNAASRAGLKITTHIVWLDSLTGYGRIDATVADRP